MYQPADLGRLKTYSIAQRQHKVARAQFGALPQRGASVSEWLAALPDFLAVRELRAVVDAIVAARGAGRPVVFALGAHVIKVGCAPLVVDLVQRGIVTALACNGATAIHDVELATLGETSEEVADTIRDGSFGMVAETMAFFARAAELADQRQGGLGAAIGELLIESKAPWLDGSILAAAQRATIPATVHVALGTDTIHMADALDGAKIGAASLLDFRLLCSVVADLGADPGRRSAARRGGQALKQPGGVWCNIGSAVVLPEVFLKAVSVARNLGADLDAVHTANFDMLRHYRTRANVVTRPVTAGHGHELIGHHEIMLPLLRQALLERMG